jgi:hypothetical protein
MLPTCCVSAKQRNNNLCGTVCSDGDTVYDVVDQCAGLSLALCLTRIEIPQYMDRACRQRLMAPCRTFRIDSDAQQVIAFIEHQIVSAGERYPNLASVVMTSLKAASDGRSVWRKRDSFSLEEMCVELGVMPKQAWGHAGS